MPSLQGISARNTTDSQGVGVAIVRPGSRPRAGGALTRIIRESVFHERAEKSPCVLGRLRNESIAEDTRHRVGTGVSKCLRLAGCESDCGACRLEVALGAVGRLSQATDRSEFAGGHDGCRPQDRLRLRAWRPAPADQRASGAAVDVFRHHVDGDLLAVRFVRVQIADGDQAVKLSIIVDDRQVTNSPVFHRGLGLFD